MERHAYINIEPNNGGIVLNVSDGGLCFHSFDPVQRNGTIRFWFSGQNQRIEADGTLAWADETQKGGLRFTALPAEAREKIREWMSQPKTPLAADLESAAAGSPLRAVGPFNDSPDKEVVPHVSAPLAIALPELKVRMQLSGFSRGLATGLVISAVVAGALLLNGYRGEFGEWLIQLGERFAAKPQSQILAVSAASPAVLPAAQTVPAATPTVSPTPQIVPAATQTVLPTPEKITPTPAPRPVPQSEKILPQPEKLAPPPSANQAKPQPAKLDLPGPLVATPTTLADAAPKPPAPVVAPAISQKPQALPVPTSGSTPAIALGSNPIPNKPVPTPKPEAGNQPGVHTEDSRTANPDSTSELYFEVGKFKNPLQAHDETEKLAQLGFPATAVQKGFLWTNSYHILVGPYGDEEGAKATHDNLVSNGFKPRTFERGSRNFTILSSVTTDGGRAPEGDYIISWESYVGNASVKFLRNNSLVASADGKWVKHDAKYPRDAYVYRRNPDGSRTLLEIHFEGMRQTLVF